MSRTGLWVQALVAAVLFGVSAHATVVLSRAGGGVASIWIANALLLGYALHQPRRSLPGLLIAAVAGSMAATVATGRPLPIAFMAGIFNALEVAIAYALLARLRLMPGVAMGDRSLLLMLGVTLAVAPALSGALGATVATLTTDMAWLPLFKSWWLSDAFGMFAVLPLLWSWQPGALRTLLRGTRAIEYMLLCALTVVVCALTMRLLSHPFVLIAIPLLLVAVRSSVFGTSVANLLAIGTVLASTMLGRTGTIALDEAFGGAAPLTHVWMYACIAAAGPLLVSAVIAQRERMRAHSAELGERLKVVADAVPAYIAQLDTGLRYRFANQRYLDWLGKAPADMIGRTPADVLGEAPAAALEPAMLRALAGERQRFDFTLPSGQVLDVMYEPNTTGNGAIDGFYVMAHDVTWRASAERRFRDLLESAPDPMVVMDPADGRLMLVNAQVERVFGHPRETVLDTSMYDFVPDAATLTTEQVRAHLEANQAGGAAPPFELTGVRSDGTRFPIEVVLSRLQGSDTPQLVATIRDVSARHRAEQALHAERERAQVTLDSIAEAVVTCDTGFRITSMNPVAEAMTGCTAAEATGQVCVDVLQRIHSHTGVAMASPLELAMAQERTVEGAFEVSLRHRDGHLVPVEETAAPLRDREGRVVGGVMVFHDVSESRAMAQKMSHLAHHDHLTGLPNRVLLNDRLDQVLKEVPHGRQGALLFVDLDFFKHINDSLGHQVGDRVLQEVAGRLARVVRPDDTVSRQGGDEFVVLLSRLKNPSDAARVAEKLLGAVERPLEIDGRTLHVSASIGVALFPQDGNDIRTLMKQADTALYAAKQAGRRRFSYFTQVMSERADQRMRLEHELRTALGTGELFLVYQPKVSLPGQTISGMEALLRWRQRDGRVVPPSEFIPVAEETGLIVAIDEWVMREACRQNRAWVDAGLPRVPVAVNMSLAHLDAERMVDNVRRALHDSGLAPELLDIEFTESQMLGQHERAQQLIEGIRALGVRMSVDDFGTGYSSLGYLTTHRFDTIKIDRSFVQGLPGQIGQLAVVQAIMGMAHALDYRVVGEGVETVEQAIALQRNGCHEVQGYLYSPPVEAVRFEQLLRTGLTPHLREAS
jgi:diguanylate cyclase (GGDEF)-like protein/PAS domain S-box-containing protein